MVKKINNVGIYTDFYFNNKKLSDFGGIIMNEFGSRESFFSNREAITTNVIGIDGEIFYGIKTGSRTWNKTIYFENLVNTSDIKNWFKTKSPVEFYYVGDDYKINCIVTGEAEIEVYNNGNDSFCGTLEITFTAFDPHYFKRNENTRYIDNFGWSNKIHSDGNSESYPRFKFLINGGVQDISFAINHKICTITNVSNYLVLDSMTREVFDSSGRKLKDFTGKYPVLLYGDNDFAIIKGHISRVEILKRERYE